MSKKMHTYFQNAYTSTPVQDNFNQLGFIPNGLSRIELIALHLYTNSGSEDTIKENILLAAQFIDEIEKYKEELQNKTSTLEIIK